MAILRLTFSNQLSEIRRVGFALAEFLEEEGATPATTHRVRLVVEELIVNVIQHAFIDGDPHTALLDIRTEPGGIAIVVEDDGVPFDPRKAHTPALQDLIDAGKSGGLGVEIIRKITRDLSYERVDGKNRVRAFIAHASHNTPR